MDKEMMEKIKASAEQIEMPESLMPENIEKRLGDGQADSAIENPDVKYAKMPLSGKLAHFPWKRVLPAAMVAVFALWMLPVALRGSLYQKDGMATAMADVTDGNAATTTGADERISYDIPGVMHSATDYEEIYDVLLTAKAEYQIRQSVSAYDMGVEDYVTESVEDSISVADGTAGSANTAVATEAAADYSMTNLRTENVDESDIVKTDGDYIYQCLNSSTVRIIKIDGGKMEEAARIELEPSADSSVGEMYLSDGKLILITRYYETGLYPTSGLDGVGRDETDTAAIEDVYRIQSSQGVRILTFDIKDPAAPKEIGEVTLEGNYHTSRLVNGYLYVMATYGEPLYHIMGETTAVTEDAAQSDVAVTDILPRINGATIAATDVLLPESVSDDAIYGGTPFYVMTAISLDDPDQVTDTKAVMGYVSNTYVSADALFFYSSEWTVGTSVTNIVRFDYGEGYFIPRAAGSVRGEIDDTFALDEDADGNLRVATTAWTEGGNESSVYVLDENLKTIGSLVDIAGNEQVKSCRFMGDIAYVVTYRNTDPLFSIDLSDPRHPTILGELKIPGFSEYLHFWGDGKLLGIGYETDETTGAQTGVKLSMFDISDPADVTEEAKLVLADVDSVEALYGNYKQFLVDSNKNLIGFAATDWDGVLDGREQDYYLLFSYEDGKFKDLLSEQINTPDTYEVYGDASSIRGLYAGDTFYLVSQRKITAYDMKDDYKRLSVLE